MTNDIWLEAPLDHFLTRATYGFTNPMPTTTEGPYMVTAKDINAGRILYEQARRTSSAAYSEKLTDKSRPNIGDVLVTKDGTLGRIAIVDRQDVCVNQSVAVLQPKPSIRPAFLKLVLEEPKNHQKMLSEAEGSTIKHIYITRLAKQLVRVPSINIQDLVLSVLTPLERKIELNRRMNETLEAMARALFRDWFVDFGPTRAKMAGEAPYLSPDLWSLFPGRLDDEGKPEGWDAGALNAIASLNPESWTAKNSPRTVAYVDLANTKWGNIDKVERYDWADAPSRARRILRPGDTIVGTVRPGNGSFTHIGEDGLTGSTGFAVLRPMNPRDRAFVWCAATSPENIDRLTHLADGGAYPAVRPEVVVSTDVVIPDAKTLDAFCYAVAENLSLIEANKEESRTLAQTRDLLLPRLMSGELRVAEAAQIAEGVA